jgi:hypothetical protein
MRRKTLRLSTKPRSSRLHVADGGAARLAACGPAVRADVGAAGARPRVLALRLHLFRRNRLEVLDLSVGTAFAQSWRGYANARFGTVAQVPGDWRVGREPENGDGLDFTSPDGQATITVFGGLNIDDSVEQVLPRSNLEQCLD